MSSSNSNKSLNQLMPLQKSSALKISKLEVEFEQPVDDMAPRSDYPNTLRVSIEDGGAGGYLVLKTKRWAMDENEIDGFATLLKKVVEIFNNSQDFNNG